MFTALVMPVTGLICLAILIVVVGYARWTTHDVGKERVFRSLEKLLMVVSLLFIVLSIVVIYLEVNGAI